MSPSPNDKRIPLSLLKQLPKAELHTHLDGCIRTTTLIDLAKKDNVQLPGFSPGEIPAEQELQDILLPPGGASSLVEFLRAYDFSIPVLQNTSAMKRVFREMAEDYAKDGVSYLEVRFCPALHTNSGCTSEEILRAVIEESRAVSREAKNGGVLPITRIIVCALRNLPISSSKDMAELAVNIFKEEEKLPIEERQLVGFDLAGDEAAFETKLFADAFDHIRTKSKLGITIHSGEAAGWESVKQAIDIAGASRLGHGVRLIENQTLLEQLAKDVDNPTTIEVCVTSNVLTKAVESLDKHPARKFFDSASGLRIVPCTDGSTMIGKSLSEQYEILQDNFAFSPKELVTMIDDSFLSSFCDPTIKNVLLDNARSKYQSILYEFNLKQ